MKKMLSALLILIIVLSAVSISAFAAVDEGETPDGIPDERVQLPQSGVEFISKSERFKPVKLTEEMFNQIFGALEQQEGIHIYINDEIVVFPDTKPQIVNDRTLVPVRFVAEQLGADVGYQAIDKKEIATITTDEISIILVAGDTTAIVNGVNYTLDVPATIIDGRMMVPFRFIFETFGMNVDYQEKVNTDGKTVSMIIATSN